MVRQVLNQWFWDVYDHLGRLLFINLVLFFLFLPVFYYVIQFALEFARQLSLVGALLFMLGILVVVSTLLGTVWASGTLYFGHLVSKEKDPSVTEFLKGVRTTGGRVFCFMITWSLIYGILLLNLWYYFLSAHVPEEMRLLGYALGGICFWAILFLIGTGMHALPLAVRKPRKLRESLKLGMLLTLKYPMVTLAIILFIVGMLIVGVAVKLIGIIAFGFVGPAMLINSLHDVIVEREVAGEKQRTGKEDEKPVSWKEIRGEESAAEEERLRKARYERTLRDVLKPWEM